MKLAEKLVYLRKQHGLSQLKLAEMMDIFRQAVSRGGIIMKRIISILVSLSLIVSTLLVPAIAANTIEMKEDIAQVEVSTEVAKKFYQASLNQIVFPVSEDGNDIEVSNGGLVAYSNGYVKQTILIEEKGIGYVSGSAVDHWYRLFNSENPVCKVTIFCSFYYDRVIAKPEQNTYSMSTYIYPEYRDQTYITEKSVTFKNGVTGSTTARVDVDYSVNFNILLDNETISLECDKNGNLTYYEQNESI